MSSATTGPRRSRFEATLDRLRNDIEHGRFRQDDMLPGERDLAALLEVSRTTLRRMLASLVEAGLLRHRQGVGTFIAQRPSEQVSSSPIAAAAQRFSDAPRLPGFADEMRMRGIAPSSRLIAGGPASPTPDEAMMLACSPQTRIIRLSRLWLGDGIPMAVDVTVVPQRYIPDVKAIGGSLYATLNANGHRPVRALQRIEAALVSPQEAVVLDVAPGSAALAVRRVTYLADEQCCDFTRSTYRADRYDLIMEQLCSTPPAAGDQVL